jgi:PAS domain S-box-containing protein
MEEHVARYFERRHQRIPPAARIAAGPVAVPEFFQRKRMEEALRASEQRFRILAEVIPQIVWTTDASGAVDYLNPRWREYTGVPVEQGLGWDWKAVLHPDDTFHCLSLWREALRTGANFEAEVRFRRASDGVYRWQLGRALPVRDQDGRITKWFGTWTDIDDRKQAEEALRRSEQLAATGRLAATISHEINNPLEGVINLLYLIETHPRVDRSIRDYVEIAQQELARVAHIAKQTLGFYRETNEASPVNLSEILEALLRVYARKIDAKRLKVETRFDFRGNIRAYPGEMRQVFSNVLINALEASPAGGHVKLHVTWAREWNGAGRKGVRVVIADTGPGIRPEHRQRIFEPFFTTKGDKGTGLGLWVTQGIVHKHGGSVRLRSSVHPGRSGTVFSFFLPEAEAEVETYAATMRLAS